MRPVLNIPLIMSSRPSYTVSWHYNFGFDLQREKNRDQRERSQVKFVN